MNKTELNQKYELAIIVDSKISPEEKEAVLKEVSALIVRSGGKVMNSQLWIERHRLGFTIKKRQEGSYYLINLEGEGSLIKKLDHDLRIHEKILRFCVYEAGHPLQISAASVK